MWYNKRIMSSKEDVRHAGLPGSALTLFGALFLGVVFLWPIAGNSSLWIWNASAALKVSSIFAFFSGAMLLYRFLVRPMPSRFTLSAAFFSYFLATTLLLAGISFLAPQAQTSVEAMQSWLLFIPRLLLATLFCLSVLLDRENEESRESGSGKLGRQIAFGGSLLLVLVLVAEYFFPLPFSLSYGVAGRLQEILPLLLFLGAFTLVLKRGAWMRDPFMHAFLWVLLTQSIASLYLLFSHSPGSTAEIVGFLVHAVGLSIPLLSMQTEMFHLYGASEAYRSQTAHGIGRFGSRRHELTTELFRRAVEQSHDPLYITDVEGRIVFVNAGFTSMTGYLPRDVLGETPEYWSLPSHIKGAYTRLFSESRARKEPLSATLPKVRKDGTGFEAMVHISPVVNAVSEVEWFVVREHDLSEMKDRTILMQQILDNMPLGIFLLENPTTKILLSNHYADELCRRTGLKKFEKFQDIYSLLRLPGGERCSEADLPLATTLRSAEVSERDDIEIWPTGAIAPVMIWKMHTTPLFDAKGKLRHVLLAFDDITHQKELEHKMTDSISVVSHQLRTPLTGIKWALEEFRKSEQSPMSKEDRSTLFDTLYRATVRMYDVVQGLLDTSKIEQGKIELKPESVRFDTFIGKVLEDFSPMIREKQLTVKQSVLSTKTEASYDVILLRQVIQTLIDNAVKYTPAGGEIDSVLTLEKNRIHWTLHDTGIGMVKEDQEHIFEKFHRGDNAQKVDAYGMGLGLYTVKSIMDLLGGEVRFESEEGQGTTFHLLFPL